MGVNRAVWAASLEGKICPRLRKQAGETLKRHAKKKARPQIEEASTRDFGKAHKGLILKARKQADVSSKRHTKELILKARKQANMTSKGHAKGLVLKARK